MAKTSISIDAADLAWLKQRAKRLHGGNLSAAMAEGTKILRHLDSMKGLLDRLGAPRLTDEEGAALDLELDGGRATARAKRRNVRAA